MLYHNLAYFKVTNYVLVFYARQKKYIFYDRIRIKIQGKNWL